MKKFYEDEVYIKMCEKAGEIQNDHSIKKFDLFQDNNSKDIFSYDDNMMRKYIGKWIWLPRQDQLQEMIDDRGWGLIAILNIAKYNTKFTEENIDKFTIPEQFLLAFVMFQKFNKIWNGEDWVNE